MLNPKYAAGFFDAEGFVLLNLRKYIQMGFVNTKPDVIYQLQKQYGGSIGIEKHENKNHATTYRLHLFSKEAEKCLRIMEPHLVIKKEVTNIVLQFNPNTDDLSLYRDLMKQSREDVRVEVKNLSWEYIAGFFDGEGHIGITKDLRKNRPSPRYQLEVVITNTHFGILNSIYNLYGREGQFLQRKRDSIRLPTWDIKMRASKGIPFLKSMYPFLVVKKKQAEIAIKFQTDQKAYERIGVKGRGLGTAPLAKDAIDFKEQCRQELMKLH